LQHSSIVVKTLQKGDFIMNESHFRIPRIIHQTWRSTEVEPFFKRAWPRSWQEMNPEWEYRLWTDADIVKFVQTQFPDFYPDFQRYGKHIKRVDAWRYLVLSAVGGVYADMDSMCLKPLDELCSTKTLILGSQYVGDWRQSKRHVCNAFMASTSGHPFWRSIQADLRRERNRYVIEATGPGFLTRRLQRLESQCDTEYLPEILPHELLYPFAWNSPLKHHASTLTREELQDRFPNSYAVNFWTGTWTDAHLC
jgi:mannosyltransferase OCH1-like enzyme